MRDLDTAQFDYLLAIYFSEEFDVTSAYLIEHGAVVQHALFSVAQRGHVLHAKRALLTMMPHRPFRSGPVCCPNPSSAGVTRRSSCSA
jgi:hypothetical protein